MKDNLITDNLNLVHKVLQDLHIHQNNVDYEDYVQEGRIGLCRAAGAFDESKGYTFSTFAYIAIRNAVSNFYYRNQLIRFKSCKRRDVEFCEIEEWIPQLQSEDVGEDRLDDNIVSQLRRIKAVYRNPQTYQLALDLFNEIHWTPELVKQLQIKYKDYDGACANALRSGNIRQMKSWLAQAVRRRYGVKTGKRI